MQVFCVLVVLQLGRQGVPKNIQLIYFIVLASPLLLL